MAPNLNLFVSASPTAHTSNRNVISSICILTFRCHPQPEQIRRFPRSGAFIPTATYDITLFLNAFIVSRFWAVIEKWRKYKGHGIYSEHSCTTLSTVFVHKKPNRLRVGKLAKRVMKQKTLGQITRQQSSFCHRWKLECQNRSQIGTLCAPCSNLPQYSAAPPRPIRSHADILQRRFFSRN